MAKDKKPKAPTDEKQRVTGYVGTVEISAFSALCDLWSLSAGDALEKMIWIAVDSLEAKQREAVATMVRVKTGKQCRSYARPVGKIALGDGEGQGLPPDPMHAPAIAVNTASPENRIAQFAAIHKKAVGDPTDSAIAVTYGND